MGEKQLKFASLLKSASSRHYYLAKPARLRHYHLASDHKMYNGMNGRQIISLLISIHTIHRAFKRALSKKMNVLQNRQANCLQHARGQHRRHAVLCNQWTSIMAQCSWDSLMRRKPLIV